MESHQFPGARQRKTPVAAFNVILRILAMVPGPKGDALRKAQAEIAARSISGDHDLRALPMRRDEMGVEGEALAMNDMVSSTDAQHKRKVEEGQHTKRRNLAASWSTPPSNSQRLVYNFTQGRSYSSP